VGFVNKIVRFLQIPHAKNNRVSVAEFAKIRLVCNCQLPEFVLIAKKELRLKLRGLATPATKILLSVTAKIKKASISIAMFEFLN
jgi:hypothetical protein